MDGQPPIPPFPFNRLRQMYKGRGRPIIPPMFMNAYDIRQNQQANQHQLHVWQERVLLRWRDDTMVYVPDGSGKPGVCIMEPQLSLGQNYFEVSVNIIPLEPEPYMSILPYHDKTE